MGTALKIPHIRLHTRMAVKSQQSTVCGGTLMVGHTHVDSSAHHCISMPLKFYVTSLANIMIQHDIRITKLR